MLMRPDVIPDTRPLPLWQSASFATALRLIGTDAEIRPLGLAGQVMVVRRSLGPMGHFNFASRGPVWADNADDDARVQALRDARLHVINAQDTQPHVLRRAGYRRIMRPQAVAMLDLHRSADDQIATCKGKWRNAFRQGQRRNLTTVHRPYKETKHAWIFDRNYAQQKAKGYRALPPRIIRAMSQVDPRNVSVSIAYQAHKPIAAMLFLQHGAGVTYQIGWTSDAGRTANAHHVLLMQAAQGFAKQGATQMELGLIGVHHPVGLNRFKLGAGAKAVELGGTWLRLPFQRKR